MRKTCLVFLGLLSCGGAADIADAGDASADGSSDANVADVRTDAQDSGTMGDAGPGDDGAIYDGSSDDAGDGSIIVTDGGALDGALCPPCMINQACCMVMKSANYGKCYAKACLACCM